jgi:hypothetical protein
MLQRFHGKVLDGKQRDLPGFPHEDHQAKVGA